MTTYKLTKGQYEDFKESAMEKFRETFDEIVRDMLGEHDLYLTLAADTIEEYLSGSELIENNLDKIISKIPMKEIKEAIANAVIEKLTR